MDKKIKHSFNTFKGKYRYVRIHPILKTTKDEYYTNTDIDLLFKQFYKSDNYILEFKPYKPYFLYRLKWSFAKIIESKSVKKIKNFNAWSLFVKITVLVAFVASLIAIYEFIIKPNIN